MRGIFQPLYDTADLAADMEEAMNAAQDPYEAHQAVNRAESADWDARGRSRMLLVERFVDEWGESKALLRRLVSSRAERAGRVARDAVAHAKARAIDAAADFAVLVARKAGYRFYRFGDVVFGTDGVAYPPRHPGSSS